MAKVLSSSTGKIMTTKNNTPPKGKPNIGPGSTAGSRGTGITQKPSGAKTTTLISNNPKVAALSGKQGLNVPARGLGAGLPKARGAMSKFGGK